MVYAKEHKEVLACKVESQGEFCSFSFNLAEGVTRNIIGAAEIEREGVPNEQKIALLSNGCSVSK